jgi:catecholate siderophore receptor
MKAMKYRHRHAHEKGTEVTQTDSQPKAIIRSTRVSRTILTASTLGLALSGVAATPAAAQTKQAETLPAISVEGQGATPGDYKTDRSASAKRPSPLVDTPQTITVIPRAVIEDQNATTLREVLRNSPGITFGAGEGGGAQGEQLRIRGFSASTDLFLDGMRDFSVMNNRDPFNLEQVEVVKGASSTQSGRGATGGAVGLYSKTPNLKKSIQGSATVGTAQTRRATADVNIPLEPYGLAGAAVRLNAMAHTAEVAGRDEAENKRWGIAPSIAFGLNGPTKLTFSYLHERHDNVPDYGIPTLNQVVPPVDRSNWYGVKGLNKEEQQRDIFTALLEHEVNEQISLRNQLRYAKSSRFNIVTIPRFPTGTTALTPTTTVTRGQAGRDESNTQLINQTDATIKFKTGLLDHTAIVGMELSREEYERDTLAFNGTVAAANLWTPNPNVAYPSWYYGGARAEATGKTVAFYAFDTAKIGESWEVTGGLRWDRFDAKTKSVAVGGATTGFDRTDYLLNWNGALVYKPAKNGSVYISASTSYNPSAEGLAAALNATTANTDPQKNVTYEIGTKWDLLNEQLSLTAALFRTTKTNVRDTDAAGNTVILNGERRTQGLELGVSGQITKEWSVIGGYTYIDSEVTKALQYVGNELANTARHSFSLWTTYETPWDVKVGGGVQYVGARYMTDANIGKMGAYTLFDAMVSYPVTEKVEVQLNGYNLFDKEYFDKAHGGGGHVIPGAGRTVLLSTNVKF